MDYQFETAVRRLDTRAFLQAYYRPAQLRNSCGQCPFYGKDWSCPPEVPKTEEFFAPFASVVLVGVKVVYDQLHRDVAKKYGVQAVQDQTYGVAKRCLNDALLALEGQADGAISIAAGRCERCTACARQDGKPCRKPNEMRYSFSAFEIALTDLAAEELGFPLQWSADELPAYNVAIAALLLPDAPI